MTTALITKGMTRQQAIDAIRDKAIEHSQACGGIGFWVESGNKEVLVGLARPGHAAVVLEFDKDEFDGLQFLERIGIDTTPAPPPAIERARVEKARVTATKKGKKACE